MHADFWLTRWQNNEIGFHRHEVNPLLIKHLQTLNLPDEARVFVPLCGKTLDIGWLMAQGFRVVGIELSEKAVLELFAQLQIEPMVSRHGDLTQYQAKGIDIYVGDFFQLTAEILGSVDACYDRAALIALPESTRVQYSSHLCRVIAGAPQLLITLAYDQQLLSGPPFSVTDEEVSSLYGTAYQLTVLESLTLETGLKGKYPTDETIWLLT